MSFNITPQIAWASTRPILKLMFIMGVGMVMSKRRTLTPEGSKIIATVLIWVLYPSLLFTKVVIGIDTSNLKQFGIMSVASVFMLSMGLVIGYVVLKLVNPPKGFRYGCMLAVAMGNHGDLPIAIVLSLGDQLPFSQGDASKGIAYISGFLCLTNLFFFSIGYKLFGEDFRDINNSPDPSMMDISLPNNIHEAREIVASSRMDSPVNISASPSTQTVPSGIIPTPGSAHAASTPAAMALTRASSFKNVLPSNLIRRESFSLTSRMADAGGSEAGDPNNGSANSSHGQIPIPLRERAEVGVQRNQGELGKASSTVLNVDDHYNSNSPLDVNGSGGKKPHAVGWMMRAAGGKADSAPLKKVKISEETWFWIKAFGNLANIATVVGLIVAVVPFLKALFIDLPNASAAPSTNEPPFLFLFETLKFLGDAAVPLGLVNLGAALGRLNLRSLLPIRITLAIAFARLVMFPLIGFAIIIGLTNAGVVDRNDKMLRFVLLIETGVPTASSTVFFTQLWHPKGEADNIASVVLIEYTMAAVSMIVCLAIALSIVSV
ncbi:auxin efflux carrier [Chytridium lagenaria]|nr:auxin efflux carrier [Chytridium lagenaria]